MNSFLRRLTRSTFERLRTAIRSVRWLRSVLYESENVAQFQDIVIHERMLADSVRLDAYAAAIRRVVKRSDVVLDLGCGTGILSLFAAQNHPDKIYALDHSRVIDVAKRVAEYNGARCIEFINVNSQQFTPDRKVDVIIHEQMGAFLFDEDMIANLMDLKRRILKPGGQIVPAVFELFLEPVCLKREYRHPFIWENNIHGVDYSGLKNDKLYKSIRPDTQQVQKEPRAQCGSLEYYLCNPAPVLTCDLNAMSSANEMAHRVTARKTVTRPGAADGVSIYFKTIFDVDNYFDTALDSPNTNWRPPFFRIPRCNFEVNDVIVLTLDMGSVGDVATWSITLTKENQPGKV